MNFPICYYKIFNVRTIFQKGPVFVVTVINVWKKPWNAALGSLLCITLVRISYYDVDGLM